jgi:alcohol dehydrogenase class IV
MDVNFLVPTQIIMGENCVKQNAERLADLGKLAFIVTGGKSAKLSGALDDVTQVLAANGQKWTLYDKVTPNPLKEQMFSGAEELKEAGADFVIAIGGGSPMDAGKAIAYYAGEKDGNILPIVAIPTTAGTGSEVTQYAILTDHEKQTKVSLASPSNFPKLALLDAKYTLTLSAATTVNTAIDALSHALEGMLSVKGNVLTDILAAEALRLISALFPQLKKVAALTLAERQQLLYASTLAGMVIANTGTTGIHSMGYSLTYFQEIDHGRANGLVMPEFLRFVERSKLALVAEVLAAMRIDSVDDFAAVIADLLGEREEISDDEFVKYSSIAIQAWSIKNSPVVPSESDLIEIYKASFYKT